MRPAKAKRLCAPRLSNLRSDVELYPSGFKPHRQLNNFRIILMCFTHLCPTRGPVEGFVRPSLGFLCSNTGKLSLFR